MAEKSQGYWDVDRCAWVRAGQRNDVPAAGAAGLPTTEPAETDQPEVPEQRPADASTMDAPTPA